MFLQRNRSSALPNNDTPVIESVVNIFREFGTLGFWLFAFSFMSIAGVLLGNLTFAVISLFYVISIIVRIFDTWSDAVAVESVGTFGIITMLISNVWVAVFFVFTAMWLTRHTSPFGPVEDYTETIGVSIALVVSLAVSQILPGFAEGNMVKYIISYTLVRFAVYQALIILLAPAIVFTEFFYTLVSIPLVIIQSYLIMILIGMPILHSFGIENWIMVSLGSLF